MNGPDQIADLAKDNRPAPPPQPVGQGSETPETDEIWKRLRFIYGTLTGCNWQRVADYLYEHAQRQERALTTARASAERARKDGERLDKLAALVTESEFCIQVCCDDLNYPSPAWWLERDDQLLPVNLKEYAPDLRTAIDAARLTSEGGG